MLPLLVTGGCGFIGSNYIRYLLETDPSVSIVNIDRADHWARQRAAEIIEER